MVPLWHSVISCSDFQNSWLGTFASCVARLKRMDLCIDMALLKWFLNILWKAILLENMVSLSHVNSIGWVLTVPTLITKVTCYSRIWWFHQDTRPPFSHTTSAQSLIFTSQFSPLVSVFTCSRHIYLGLDDMFHVDMGSRGTCSGIHNQIQHSSCSAGTFIVYLPWSIHVPPFWTRLLRSTHSNSNSQNRPEYPSVTIASEVVNLINACAMLTVTW